MSLFKALMIVGVLIVPILALQFSSAQAGDEKVVVPALILPDVQDGLYYQQDELIARVDKRIALRFDETFSGSELSSAGLAGPVGNPPFRP